MLAFEHRIVDALTASEPPDVRAGVEAFVSSSLAAMPRHLRFGVACASVVLGAVAVPFRRFADGARLIAILDRIPLPPIRQYMRLLRSLVLFAAEEQREPTR